MKKGLTIMMLFLSCTLYGQREINNKRTDHHQLIPGTRFYIIPPPGFASSNAFQGFREPETGSSIMVMELPAPFSESARAFDVEGLKPQGIHLQKREDIRVNGQPGLFIIADQTSGDVTFLKYMLVFGDEKGTYIVNGIFPRAVSLYHKDIIESILSVVHDTSIKYDPLAGIRFSIDATGTKMKAAHNLPGTLTYTVDGMVPPQAEDKTTVVVGASFEESPVTDHRGAAVDRIYQLPYKNLKTDPGRINPIAIGGLSGYEISAEGVNPGTGRVELIYQVMLFEDAGYYLFMGISNVDFENNLALFRKLAGTFRKK